MISTVRTLSRFVVIAILAAAMLLATANIASSAPGTVQGQLEDAPSETPTPTEEPTATPTATSTPTTPAPSGRPIVVFEGYGASGGIRPGSEFTLSFRLANAGGSKARNVMVIFAAGDFVPRSNGGVVAAGTLAPGASTSYSQPLSAGGGLAADSIGTVGVTVNYTDEAGNPFSESFTLGLYVGSGKPAGGSGGPRAATATPLPRPQLLITSYDQDVESLKPGTRFELSFQVLNVGGGTAKRVFMVLGGGGQSSDPPGDDKATNGNGTAGLSGSGGDFSNFAPVGASNVQFLSDVAGGDAIVVRQQMIVNSTTKPGAYTMRISFTYHDEKGSSFTDDQIITLLVSQPPVLEVSFYRPLDPFFAGQPGMLPIQVVNLDRNTTILGRMVISAEQGMVENGSILVGYLDPGGYFPHDAMLIPGQPGPTTVFITVEYLDDFNLPKAFTQELVLEVGEEQIIDPGMGYPPEGGPGEVPMGEETFWQTALRFVRGMLGLDSARAAGPEPGFDQAPMEPPFEESGPLPGSGPKG